MITHARSFALVCCLSLAMGSVTAACGGSDEPTTDDPTDPDDPPPPPPALCEGDLTAEQFATCFGEALVGRVFSCGLGDPGEATADDLSPSLFGDQISPRVVATIVESIGAGRADFNGAAAQACYQLVAEMNCAVVILGGMDYVLEQCGDLLVPLVQPGEACGADYECANSFCRGQDEKTPWDYGTPCNPTGVCEALAAVGESCEETSCQHGAYCEDLDDDGNYVCESGAAGTACEYSDACDEGLTCAFTVAVGGGGNNGTCQPVATLQEGENCFDAAELCELGTICLPLTPDGNEQTAVCTRSDEVGETCYYACEDGLVCRVDPSLSAELGTCGDSAPPAPGDACEEAYSISVFGGCGAFLRCEGQDEASPGTCKNPGNEGTPCYEEGSENGCNLGLFCSDEIVNAAAPVCMRAQADGAFCAYDFHCSSGFCSSAGLCGDAVACELGIPD